ncbi:MAG: helicase-associated domain-containing protein [Microbacteriaceae bacterium]
MSEILELAGRLRNLDDQHLIELSRQSSIQVLAVRDFFDLAEQLLQPRNVDAWLATQNRARLEELLSANTNQGATDDILAGFVKSTVQNTSSLIRQRIEEALNAPVRATEIKTTKFDKHSQDDAGLRAFATIQALSEFILDLEQHLVREVGKQGLALPDAKRLAGLLARELDEVRELWELASINGLCSIAQSRWTAGPTANSWHSLDTLGRWKLLATNWRESLPLKVRNDLLTQTMQSVDLLQLLGHMYPISLGQKSIDRICNQALWLGLTSQGLTQPWLTLVLEGNIQGAAEQLGGHLPPTQRRVILQGDLSVITPGPLAHELEEQLREFVDAESISLASHFRISPLSVCHSLERGHTIEFVAETLTELSGQVLPQPVGYLLNDVARKFGRIKIFDDTANGGSYVRFADAPLALELANDLRNRIISLRQLDETTLHSKYPPEVVYFTLRDFGHLAIRCNADGSTWNPQSEIADPATREVNDGVEAMVQRLRASETTDSEDLLVRQLQLAIKTKAKILVRYVGRENEEHLFNLEPIALKNGRFRGLDRSADIERTLPIANIAGIEVSKSE